MKLSDGPNGARGGTFDHGKPAACVSLAASWDSELAVRIGKGMAEDATTNGVRLLLGPTVCLHRRPTGGRNFESFSEDPFLTGKLASKYIEGLQSKGIGAAVKHFAANEQETHRFTIDRHVSERALREIYLKPFEIAVKAADPWAIMTSYNLLNGSYVDENKHLLTGLLREQWGGFQGLIMSDWGSVHSTSASLNAGHDLEMPGPGYYTRRRLPILCRLSRLFPEPIIPPESSIDRPEHRQLIRQAGADGMVLLKNSGILPLKENELKSIALLGFAKEYLGHGGGSAAVNSQRKITPFKAFPEALKGDVELRYAEGARTWRIFPPLQKYDDEKQPGHTMRVFSSDSPEQCTTSRIYKLWYQSVGVPGIKRITVTGTFRPRASASIISVSIRWETQRFILNDEKVFEDMRPTADLIARNKIGMIL
ncbi:glycosyl hydrolase family 3 N terminal domain-containing protein [Lipomyces doorenjongii]|uniref:glycosyl hydrolase family 3 N terminal domain-containing protein n=1 Tax=Lipomyces doorenjongii TaxID=383834 RepID=UPI0034CF667F